MPRRSLGWSRARTGRTAARRKACRLSKIAPYVHSNIAAGRRCWGDHRQGVINILGSDSGGRVPGGEQFLTQHGIRMPQAPVRKMWQRHEPLPESMRVRYQDGRVAFRPVEMAAILLASTRAARAFVRADAFRACPHL